MKWYNILYNTHKSTAEVWSFELSHIKVLEFLDSISLQIKNESYILSKNYGQYFHLFLKPNGVNWFHVIAKWMFVFMINTWYYHYYHRLFFCFKNFSTNKHKTKIKSHRLLYFKIVFEKTFSCLVYPEYPKQAMDPGG